MIVAIAVAVVAVLVLALVASRMRGSRRTAGLKQGFGPEYEREVNRVGRGKAESELLQRQKRVEKMEIRELTRDQASGYTTEWEAVQSKFVDDPAMAVRQADELVGRVMQDRGYPVGEFEQKVADVSVDHPTVANNYRAAHGIASKNSGGGASTEDLRQAMVHYRALFQDLLQVAPSQGKATDGQSPA
ncbi:MAG: hypothetical protein ABIP13_07280 [Tepidiformaceae bacterium]